MGSKTPVIGHHYKLLLQFTVTQAIDAFLAFRGGDRNAWEGELTSSGTIYIDAPKLWGGEEREGGIQGYADIMFGEAGQQPNAYLVANIGPKQSACRGEVNVVFKGGRYGAFNPYPKPAAFKFRRINSGWLDNTPWYPERATIGMGAIGASKPDWKYRVVDVTDPADYSSPSLDDSGWAVGPAPFGDELLFNPGTPGANPGDYGFDPQPATIVPERKKVWLRTTMVLQSVPPFFLFDAYVDNGITVWINGVQVLHDYDDANHAFQATIPGAAFVVGPNSIVVAGEDMADPPPGVNFFYFDLRFTNPTGLRGMNPAHILYDSHTHPNMDGQPTATINDASLRAAADILYAEGFGLCAEFDPNTTSVEEFQQRICNTIGGNFGPDDATGEYHLDLLRPNYDIDALPVLTDDDVLEFSEEPSILDGAANSVVVKYFDPELREECATAPVQSLGAIQAMGREITKTNAYPDVPNYDLGVRLGQRDVDIYTTPTRKFDLKVTRVAYAWRKGTRVRAKLPKRGIADMVCVITEKQSGTLRSGAISLGLAQDTYGMPSSSYVVQEPGETTTPPQTPKPVLLQAAFEAPYVELAGRMRAADLNALQADAGFLATVAADPAQSRDYSLWTRPAGGEYADQGVGEWCPTAIVVEGASFSERLFTLIGARGLTGVAIGSAAVWGDELVRIDALDVGAGTVTFGRACGDTVPHEHAAGERVWFYDDDAHADGTEYADGETVNAKLLTNTASQSLPIALASELVVEMRGRQARPYPPARVRINGDAAPSALSGEVLVEWSHRDRLLQADQLFDNEFGSIGPEAGTTYTLRWYLDDVLIQTHLGISGTSQTYTPTGSGFVRVEIESLRDGLASWQAQTRTFYYTPAPVQFLETEDGVLITLEGGEPISLE